MDDVSAVSSVFTGFPFHAEEGTVYWSTFLRQGDGDQFHWVSAVVAGEEW